MSFWNDPFCGGRVLVSRVTTITKIGVSKNKGTPKSSILIGFSFINHPFWGTPILGNTQILPPGRWSSAQTLPNRTPVRYHCWMQRQRRERHLLMPSTLVDFCWVKKTLVKDGSFGRWYLVICFWCLLWLCWFCLFVVFVVEVIFWNKKKGLLNMWKCWWFLDVFVYLIELPEPCFFFLQEKIHLSSIQKRWTPPTISRFKRVLQVHRMTWKGPPNDLERSPVVGCKCPRLKIRRRWAPYTMGINGVK